MSINLFWCTPNQCGIASKYLRLHGQNRRLFPDGGFYDGKVDLLPLCSFAWSSLRD